MTRRTRGRAGFSLIEWMMVCLIIAVMLALLLPALRAGREASERVACMNNLKQMSLALQNYETQMQVLPPGVVNASGPVGNEPVGLQIGWFVQILPFMEQSGVYNAFNANDSVYDLENTTVRMTWISALVCPSEKKVVPFRTAGTFGVSTYAACHNDDETPIDADNNGTFFLNSHIRHDDLLDGSSTTLFIGEKRIGPDDLGWASGTGATLRNTGWPIDTPPMRRYALKSSAPPAVVPPGDAVGGFGSLHPGGASFAFGDGSVRFVLSTISPRLFRLLGNRADGEMIDPSEY